MKRSWWLVSGREAHSGVAEALTRSCYPKASVVVSVFGFSASIVTHQTLCFAAGSQIHDPSREITSPPGEGPYSRMEQGRRCHAGKHREPHGRSRPTDLDSENVTSRSEFASYCDFKSKVAKLIDPLPDAVCCHRKLKRSVCYTGYSRTTLRQIVGLTERGRSCWIGRVDSVNQGLELIRSLRLHVCMILT